MDRQQRIEDWRNEDKSNLERLALTQDGQAFLMRLLAETGIFNANASTDPQEMAYLEGRRSIGIQILEMMEDASKNSAGNLLMRMYKGSAGRVLQKMFRRVNDHKIELEGIDDERGY